jgi:hypothetical protein
MSGPAAQILMRRCGQRIRCRRNDRGRVSAPRALAIAGVTLHLWASPAWADPAADAEEIVAAFAGMPQRVDGNVVDPVSRMGAPRYSQAMLGAAAMWLHRRSGSESTIPAFGERMLGWVAAHAASGAPGPSAFELGAAAEAYRLLPAASPVRSSLREWLRSAPTRVHLPRDAYNHNKQLVGAHAVLALCHLRVRSDSRQLCRLGRRVVARQLPAAAAPLTIRRAGRAVTVLADPPRLAPAYHFLTLGYLARALPLAGRPPAARRLLLAMARGALGVAAPDGDVAYWGRSQEQSWALVLGAFGLRAAAELARDRRDAKRMTSAADRLMERFARVHRGGPYALYITPAFAAAPLAASAGVDDYSNVATYAGLTAVALTWLAEPGTAGVGKAADAGGDARTVFNRGKDPFATVRHGAIWFAVRAHDARAHGGDLRYDFGLVSAKRRVNHAWADLLSIRPRTGGGVDSVGPVLHRAGRVGYPDGTRLRPMGAAAVTIDGSWRDRRGRRLRRVAFRYVATAHGVRLSFPVRRGDVIRYSVFARSPRADGDAVRAGSARVRLSLPARIVFKRGYASAADTGLVRATLTGVARDAGRVSVAIGR